MDLPFDIQVEHITQTTERYLREGKINFKQDLPIKITWHDPCHIGRHGGIFTEPRTVLQALPGATFVEMEHHAENSLCCGSVLTRIGEPATSDILADQRLQEAVDVGADALVTTCPCCIFQLRVGGNIDLPILDFSDCVVKALGYDYQDSTEFTHKMWDVFDQALLQMTIPGMAEMMEELIPVMLEILPGIMKGMIGFMRQSPAPVKEGMGGAMNLMMPAMMPMLMGQLMPKMMPAAVELMERKIPDMPDSMRELMPLILPEVMNRMTPVILKQVMPLVQPELLRQMKEAEKKIG